MYRGPAPIVTSATTFGQWCVDSTYTGNTHTVGVLELAPIGGGQRISSRARSTRCWAASSRSIRPGSSRSTGRRPARSGSDADGGHRRGRCSATCGRTGTRVRRPAPGSGLQQLHRRPVPVPAQPDDRGDAAVHPGDLEPALNMMYATGHWYPGTSAHGSRAGSTTPGSPTRRATCSPSPAPSACSSSATTTCSSSSTACSSSISAACTSASRAASTSAPTASDRSPRADRSNATGTIDPAVPVGGPVHDADHEHA